MCYHKELLCIVMWTLEHFSMFPVLLQFAEQTKQQFFLDLYFSETHSLVYLRRGKISSSIFGKYFWKKNEYAWEK